MALFDLWFYEKQQQGGFVTLLFEAYLHADHWNRSKLNEAWPQYFANSRYLQEMHAATYGEPAAPAEAAGVVQMTVADLVRVLLHNAPPNALVLKFHEFGVGYDARILDHEDLQFVNVERITGHTAEAERYYRKSSTGGVAAVLVG